MKNTLFFLIISSLLTLNAQTVTIEWDGAKDYPISFDKTVKLPFFNNKSYAVKNNVPQFKYLETVPGMGQVSIHNVQFAPLNSSERGQINLNEIPTELEYTARIARGGNEYYLAVHMKPFVREGNQIRKVTSFQIQTQQGIPPEYQEEGIYDPATQSILRSGDWYKIKIKKSGIFRLDKSFFDQNGIPTNFDPRTLKVYGNGGRMLNENPGDFRYGALQQNAIQFIGEADGSFDSGDYILFYGQGPHGWNRKADMSLEALTHRFNVYSDDAYYFISFGGQNGKRVLDMDVPGNPVQTFNDYHEYVFHEKDSINLNQIGRQWGGEMFNLEPSQTITLIGGGPATGSVIANYRMIAKDANNTTFGVSLNGIPFSNGSFGMGTFNTYPPPNTQFPVTTTGNTFAFNINVGDSSNPGAIILLDYLEVKYLAMLTFNGSQMQFRRLEDLNDGNIYGFSVSGSPRIWNISDHTTAMNVLSSGGIYKYMSTSPHFQNEFIAFNESSAFTEVEYVGPVANQNLRALTEVDYAIVVHPEFISEAARLANFRQLNDGVKVAVVTTEQIYNEFSSGAQDITAIRDFFKHLRDNGSPLKYALLFGGASYDFKNRIPNNTHFVPSYQSFESKPLGETGSNSYVTDDFFAMVDETDIVMAPGSYIEYAATMSHQADIAIGRFPAHNLAEAKVMVNKTIAYYEKLPNQGSSFGDWKTKFYLVVDDDDPGEGNSVFHNKVESTSAQFIQNNIPYATLRKLYLDGFPASGTSAGQRYPQVNQGITNAFDLGSALIVYFGHGGPRSWAQERVVTFEEINEFGNFSGLYSRLPVVLTITCDFTVWDLPEVASAGEYMFKNPVGGAVSMLTTSRPIGVSYGLSFNQVIVEHLLYVEGGEYLPLGEALRRAKVIHAYGNDDPYSVNLLGDPMLSITRPPRQIRITKINGEDAATFDGVFRALDFVEIEGEVLNVNGTLKDNSFNGKANATLFDKPINKTTFNNDGDMDILQYQEQINAIFKGGTNVTNGYFKFQFYVPKDINYEIGNGKLTVYAHNNVTDGVTTKIVKVGGQNPNGIDDDDGPTIGLYMNNLNFVDGGITDRDPYLLACLVDSTGINTSGIAIGHDITGVLDGNVEGTYVLNEYYEGGDNNPCTNPQVLDYQKGQVMYKLNRLDLGNHQIVFKAWDINNNSSEQTLDFVVMEDGSDHIYIDKLLNWPNPFTNQTYFHFEHNCDAELDVMVQIFTISGKLVKTIRQTVSAEPWREGYRTGRFAIPWDGLDDFGDKIGKGVYIYRVTARGVDTELCKGSATAIEKLVILK